VKEFAGSDDAWPEEGHAMAAKPEQQDEPFDAKRFNKELDLKIQRLLANTILGWDDCGNTQCRRERRCASDGFECIAKWRESLPPLSPKEAEARLQDFRMEIEVRKRLGGESVTAEQFEEAIRKEQAARRAALPPQDGDATPPVVEETKLAPEKQERINRAGNDDVTERDRAREPGPRITQL
jgi:hypothetical protein